MNGATGCPAGSGSASPSPGRWCNKPKLLILDEATTGLDPQTEAEICEVVQRLCGEQRLTVLAISHQPAWQHIADRVYTIVDGSTAQRLAPQTLVAE